MNFDTSFWQNKIALIDSRKLLFAEQSIFFAIAGQQSNGQDYIAALYAKGVRHFVVSSPVDEAEYSQAQIIVVDNVVATLQAWASYHRQQFDMPIVAITGSNGKTIIKEWLYQLLQGYFSIIKSPKSYNSQIGVPLSVLGMQAVHNLAIFEAGISQVGEMQQLERIIKPTIGIFTNIGKAHAAGFGPQTQKVNEKLALFKDCDTIIYRYEHQKIREQIAKKNLAKKGYSWGDNKAADLPIVRQEQTKDKTIFKVFVHKNEAPQLLTVPFVTEAAIENCLHAVATCLCLGITLEQVQPLLSQLKEVPMRLELKEGIHQCNIVDDSYNNDFEGLKIALDFLSQKHKKHKSYTKTVILSDILESKQDNLYINIVALLQEHQIHKFIGIGKQIYKQKWLFSVIPETHFYETTSDFLAAQEAEINFYQETILLKGARHFEFERIAQQLKKRVHGTKLEISLTALANNFNCYKKQLQPNTKIMVMVKASAYGSGSAEVAQLLQYQQVDYLGVAYVDEGVALRKRGIVVPIIVMNTAPAEVELLVQYQLQPVIYDETIVGVLMRYLAQQELVNYPVHLELDTGMARLGFVEKDIPKLIATLEKQQQLQISSIFAHLAVADEPEQADYTHQQATLFERLATQIKTALNINPMLHLLNSAGMQHYPQYQFDMVRLGIGLYGISTQINSPLQAVAKLTTTILQIKTMTENQTIGYGRKGKLSEGGKIAILAVGYADGFLRALGNGNIQVKIANEYAPTIGNICMDMCFIDITHLPKTKVGDTVVLFEDQRSIQRLANAMQTIPYEVLTNINDRVPRVFYED